jgi:hypothetical protein
MRAGTTAAAAAAEMIPARGGGGRDRIATLARVILDYKHG